jgi:TonB family protein
MSSFSRRGSATLLSLAIHAGVVAILFLIGGYSAATRAGLIADHRIISLLDPLRTDLGHAGRGGGGNHSLTPPSRGQLPPHREFQMPLPVASVIRTPLLVEPPPSLTVDTHIDSKLLQFGDPHGVPGPPSSGPGNGGGLGPGDGTGIGNQSGPGGGDGGPGTGMGSIGGVTRPPVLVWKVDPDYSDSARKAKVQGMVLLRVAIDKSGRIEDVRVDRGIGLGLDEKAVQAVWRWKFLPGMRNGKVVATTAVVEVHFRLL